MATQTCHVCAEKFPYHAPVCDKCGAKATFWQLYGRVVALCVAGLIFTFCFRSAFMWFFVDLVAGLMLLSGLFSGLVRKDWRAARLCFLEALICVLISVVCFFIVLHINGQREQEAAPVIAAIERYRADTGSYAAEPGLLVPRYLPALPESLANKGSSVHLRYHPIKTGAPILSHDSLLSPFSQRIYDFERRRWYTSGD